MNKKFEHVDDNPGSYFGMLVESFEDKKNLRNWIEKKVGKQMSNMRPTKIGYKHGRPYYAIDFTDGTSDDYFIDFDKEEIEKCESLKEDKFVPQDKMSKKAQKELNDKKRGTWGNTSPVTKVQPNKKAYDRKRDKKVVDESFDNDVNVLVNLLSDRYCDEDGIVTKDSYDSVYKYLGKNYSEKIRDAVMDNLVTEFGLPTEYLRKRDSKVVDEDIENKDSEEYLGVDEVKRFVNAREKLLDISDSMTTDLRLGRISREDVLYYRNEIKEIYSFLNSLYFGR